MANRSLRNRRVLVVDTAIGHGDTIDELALLARAGGAFQVAAAAILSRLSGGAEEALAARFDNGFARLYPVPIRPFTVPASAAGEGCQICSRKQDIRRVAKASGVSALRDLAKQLETTNYRRKTIGVGAPQQMVFPTLVKPLLERCRRSVASGVTLHALHTAMGDGMAPLSVAELLDERIPVANRGRAAMLQDLPAGVLRWSGESLTSELNSILKNARDEDVWVSAAEVFAREGYADWVDHLHRALDRGQDRALTEGFWRGVTYAAYRVGIRSGDSGEHLRRVLRELLKAYRRTPVKSQLESMLKAASSSQAAEIAG